MVVSDTPLPPISFVESDKKKRNWKDRDQYGSIIKHLISSQLSQYKKERNRVKKTKISQNIGYLCQIQTSLINSEIDIEERLRRLEQLAGVVKKGVIKK
ncbi:MAG TPA: hypothetical protein VJ792_04215 [Candidatus Nitrosotalea sp.]|nr:hypothetical protein [Candidatus Nitrosotalea sp.]